MSIPENDGTLVPTAVRGRLPAGRHKLPREFVARSQRDRLLDAMVQACAAEGYGDATVAAVITRAGVSRKTFYEHFRDRDDCFLVAYDTFLARFLERVIAAYQRPELEWPARVRAAIGALLAFLAREPAFAWMGIVEVLAADERAVERYRSAVNELAGLLDEGRGRLPNADEVPAETATMVIEGAAFLIRREILAGHTEELETLRPDITYAALVPYLGQDEALRQAQTGTGMSQT
jgi:AcrR family transcriptional regulator